MQRLRETWVRLLKLCRYRGPKFTFVHDHQLWTILQRLRQMRGLDFFAAR
jgi:hypothetical protein